MVEASSQLDSATGRTRPARVIAVGNHINLDAAVSEEQFTEELVRIFSLAVPLLASDRPNLVALGELLGLPLALTGRRGFLSRRMHSSSLAIALLVPGYARRMWYYRRRLAGMSLVSALLLTVTSVPYRHTSYTVSTLTSQ